MSFLVSRGEGETPSRQPAGRRRYDGPALRWNDTNLEYFSGLLTAQGICRSKIEMGPRKSTVSV